MNPLPEIGLKQYCRVSARRGDHLDKKFKKARIAYLIRLIFTKTG